MGLLNFVMSLNRGVSTPTQPPEELTPATNWLGFNGYNNFATFGDLLDSLFSANDTWFAIEWRMRNYLLTDSPVLFTKLFPFNNNRTFTTSKNGNDLSFGWYRTGASSEVKSVNFADCLTDTNEHKCRFEYDGSIDTNNGLDRVKLFIDDVEVTSGKTLSVNSGTLGGIYASTALLSFGQYVDYRGDLGTAPYFTGEIKDLNIYSAPGVAVFSGLNKPIATPRNAQWTQYEQPILNGSKIYNAQDACQCTFNAIVDTGTHYYLYYLGANPNVNSDRDETCLAIKAKSDDLLSGWNKYVDEDDLPIVVYGVGVTGKFDAKQVWLRCVLKKDDGTYEAWPMGQNASDTFGIGYSTSPDGITWTRQNSGNAVFTDGPGGTITYGIVKVGGLYYMVYSGQILGTNRNPSINVATSSNGTSWIKIHTNILEGEGVSWPCALHYSNGRFYIWFPRKWVYPNGMGTELVIYSTEDFINFQYHGVQAETEGSSDSGMTASMGLIKKPNGKFAFLRTAYRNQINKAINGGEEHTHIKLLELDNGDLPVAGKPFVSVYPSNVVRHWPLGQEYNKGLTFSERITKGTASINSTPVFSPLSSYGNRKLGFVTLSGSQTITADSPTVNPVSFGVKMRVEVKISGTHQLFRIGDDVLMTLESGNLRVRLSGDGESYQKDYISTADLSKPTDMNYIDDHIYVGFVWNGGVLTLFNDFVPFSVTETVDDAMSGINLSGSPVLIGQNAALRMRSVSLLSGITNKQWIDLEL